MRGRKWTEEFLKTQCSKQVPSPGRKRIERNEVVTQKRDDRSECLRVIIDEDVVAEGAVEYLVRGRVQSAAKDREGVFVGNASFMTKFEVLVANSIVTCSDDFIPVRLMFSSPSKVCMSRGTHIGDIHLFSDKDGYTENVRNIGVSFDDNRESSVMEKFETQLRELPRDQEGVMREIISEFLDVFSKNKFDLGFNCAVEHRIDTGGAAPVACATRRVPVALESKIDDLIEQLLEQKIIQPSESPWNSPIVVVAKKNGDVRMCIDYRKLNSLTRRPIFPIPDAQQICDTLHGSEYFSTIDLSQGYYQIPVADEDVEKTAFSTRMGHYEFLRMPFGLCSAPATFQQMMHKVLSNHNWEKCLIYIDDVLIFGRSAEEHYQRLRSVLQRIREAGLKLSPEKCVFMQREVEFLGHVIGKDGIKTSDTKIEKILKWPTPANEDQLRSFLGLCGYYRRFIKGYCYLAAPLEKLCQGTFQKSKPNRKTTVERKLEWNEQHEQNFQKLKNALVSAPVLSFPTREGHFILDTDACHDGIGAVLSQVQEGKEKVIAYASHKLSQSERQYCITRKELLAVYKYTTQFKHYLYGKKFTIRTDHRALCWMLNWKRPSTSQYCSWIAELENYDFEIHYRPGKEHINADALSRLPSCEQCELKHEEPKRRRNVKVLDHKECKTENIRKLSMSAVKNWNQEEDQDIKIVFQLMKSGKMKERCPEELKHASYIAKKLWSHRESLRIRGDMLFLAQDDQYALVVPRRERKMLILNYHQSLGHIGIGKLVDVMKRKFYWPSMSTDIRLIVNTCRGCAERKVKAPIKHNPEHVCTGYPFEKIAVDIAGPLQPSRCGDRYILAIIDYFSKFPMLIPLRNIDSKTVAEAIFTNWICLFGVPDVIHSDRGSCFESELFYEMCRLAGISKSKTAPYYPQSDGLVERLFRTVKDMIHITATCFQRDWREVIPIVELGLRSTIQRSTNLTPFEVVFGKRMKTPVEWAHIVKWGIQKEGNQRTQCQSEYVLELQRKMAEIHMKVIETCMKRDESDKEEIRKKVKPLQIGDKCMAKVLPRAGRLYDKRYNGPYVVTRLLGDWTYELKHIQSGEVIQRNYYQVKKIMSGSNWSEERITPRRQKEDSRPKRSTAPPKRLGFHH